MPLTRATTIRANEPFDGPEDAAAWLESALASEDVTDAVIDAGIDLVADALHAYAVASADPSVGPVVAARAVGVRIGYGSGEETAEGAFREAREIDVWATGSSRRRRRQEDLRPQERVAAILRGRERFAVCESLLLRARADLDAGRPREAALQLRIGFTALLAELSEALDDDDHRRDIAALEEWREPVDAVAERALVGELDEGARRTVRDVLATAERVLRRRRVLSGS